MGRQGHQRTLGWLCLVLATGQAYAVQPRDNVGQSIAHPLTRADLRLKYFDFAHQRRGLQMDARVERPFDLAHGWKVTARVSMTGWISDEPSSDNPRGDVEAGTGDLFTQVFFVAPPLGLNTLGFGGRNFFPTAGAEQFGRSRYRFAPFVVYQRQSTVLPAGSFYGLGVRYEFSYAGDRDFDKVDELQVVPVLTVLLPRQTFITLFPEIVIDFEHGEGAFVPLDLEFGRKYTPNRAASVRMQVPLKDDLERYDWAVELRWSMFF